MKKPKKRSVHLHVELNLKEKQKLLQLAAASGCTKAAMVRQLILRAKA